MSVDNKIAIICSPSFVDYDMLFYIFDSIKLPEHRNVVYIIGDNGSSDSLVHKYLSDENCRYIQISADDISITYHEIARTSDTVLYINYDNDDCDLSAFEARDIYIHRLIIKPLGNWYFIYYKGNVDFISRNHE